MPLCACGEPAPPPPEPALQAPSPFDEADRLRSEGRSADALAAYTLLRDDAAARGHRDDLWRAQMGLLRCLIRLGRYPEVRDTLTAIRSLAAGSPSREGWIAYLQSTLLQKEGDLEAAWPLAERAAELARISADLELERAGRHAIGTLHSLAGRYREALVFHEQWVEVERHRDPASRPAALALNALGIDYRHFGRYDEAIRVYEESLGIYRAAGDLQGQAVALYNLASIYAVTGDLDRALEHKQVSLRLAEQTGDSYGLGLLHNDLGEIFRTAGNLPEARRHLDEALAINRRARQTYGEVLGLEYLARLELDAGRAVAALSSAQEAQRLADGAGLGKEQATVRCVLARIAAANGDAMQALAWADAAMEKAAGLGDPDVEFEALEARAIALEAAAEPSAPQAYLRAIDLLESWRGRLAMGDLQMGVVDLRLDVYEGAIRGMLEQHRPADAFGVAERGRARLLLDLMAERRASGVAASAVGKLRERLREANAAPSPADDAARLARADAIETLAGEISDLERREALRDPSAAAALFPRAASIDAVRAGLAPTGQALLAFFWGKRDVYGWWVEPGRVSGARLGSVQDLAPIVEFLSSLLEDSGSGASWHLAARRAFERLVAPLSPSGAADLLVIPDGPLCHLPLEAMIPGPRPPPWGVDRRLTYGPSAAILLALAREPGPASFERAALIIADPSLPGPGSAGSGDGQRDVALARLPFAADEARQIARRFDAQGADVLLGSKATRENWLALHPERFRYLHFATHAQVDDRRPERTRLILAGGSLTLADIRRLDLPADLVVLSACDSALGRRVRGEGIIGLPHAFLAAGAREVLVALWRVDDRGTAEFMERFYAEIVAGHTSAEALRRVRRASVSAGDHPSVWAPFVLISGG